MLTIIEKFLLHRITCRVVAANNVAISGRAGSKQTQLVIHKTIVLATDLAASVKLTSFNIRGGLHILKCLVAIQTKRKLRLQRRR